MGLSIQFTDPAGTDGPFTLATSSGWAAFGAWAGTLPAGEFGAVRALADAGEVKGTDTLAVQLMAALNQHSPDQPAVADTVRGLLDNLGVGDPGESAAVVE